MPLPIDLYTMSAAQRSAIRASLEIGSVASYEQGTAQGQVPTLGTGGKFSTSVLPVGTSAGEIPVLGTGGKLDIARIPTGTAQNQVPILGSGGKLALSTIPTGTTVNTIPLLGTGGKLAVGLLPTGTAENQIPILGAGGKLPASVIPTIALSSSLAVANQAARLALSSEAASGKVVIDSDSGKSWMLIEGGTPSNASHWLQIGDRDISIADVANLQATLDGKVALTGNQTIAGTKTFSDTLVLPDGSSSSVGWRFASESVNTGWCRTGPFGVGYVAAGALRFRIKGGDAVEVFTPELNLSTDVRLFRDSSNVLALRNGTSRQVFRIYNTYTSGSDYEMAFMGWGSNDVFSIGTIKAGSGVARNLRFLTDNLERMSINAAGDINMWNNVAIGGLITAPNQNYASPSQLATIGEVRRKVGVGTGDLRTISVPALSTYTLDYTIEDLTGTQGGYAEIMVYGPFSTSTSSRGVFVVKAVYDVSGGALNNAKVVVENPMTTSVFDVTAEYVDAESLIRITVNNLSAGTRSLSARVSHALGRSS